MENAPGECDRCVFTPQRRGPCVLITSDADCFLFFLQDATPETAGDYERLIVATPNDSLLWVKFMAFKLSLADVEVNSTWKQSLAAISSSIARGKVKIFILFFVFLFPGTLNLLSYRLLAIRKNKRKIAPGASHVAI